MSEAGYRQALENFCYEIEGLCRAIEAHCPENPEAAAFEFVSKGPIFDKLKDRVRKLDHIAEVIAETYGKTDQEIDADSHTMLKDHAVSFLFKSN